MDMPKRRRWFNGMVSPQRRNGLLPVTGNHRLQSPTAFEAHEAECQTDCDQDGWPRGQPAVGRADTRTWYETVSAGSSR